MLSTDPLALYVERSVVVDHGNNEIMIAVQVDRRVAW